MKIFKWYSILFDDITPCRLNVLLQPMKYMSHVLLMPPVHYMVETTVTTVQHVSSGTQTVYEIKSSIYQKLKMYW